jgi:hypothetical protein
LAYQGLEENFDKKITCSSRFGVDAAGQPPAHRKRRFLKNPLEKIWMDVTYDISYVRGLYG